MRASFLILINRFSSDVWSTACVVFSAHLEQLFLKKNEAYTNIASGENLNVRDISVHCVIKSL